MYIYICIYIYIYVYIYRLWFSDGASCFNPVLRRGPLRWQPNHWAHRRTSNRRMGISSQGICQWSPGIVSSGCIQDKNTLPVGSPNYSGIAEMDINKKHTLLIFTDMILNDLNAASANPSHWGDVSHGGQHRNATMLDLGGATSLEVLHASVGGKAGGIPKSDGGLNAQLIFECTQRRRSVVGPVTPGTSCETILQNHQNRFTSRKLLLYTPQRPCRHMWTYVWLTLANYDGMT